MSKVDLALEFLEICEDDGCDTVKQLKEVFDIWALCENYGCTDLRELEQLFIAWKNE